MRPQMSRIGRRVGVASLAPRRAPRIRPGRLRAAGGLSLVRQRTGWYTEKLLEARTGDGRTRSMIPFRTAAQEIACSNNVRELLTFFRVRDWVHFVGFGIFGVLLGTHFPPPLSQTTLAVVLSALYLAYGFSLNQYWDQTLADARRRTRRDLWRCYVPFVVAGALAAGYARDALWPLGVGLLASECYSSPLLRAKGIPGLDLLFNSGCFVPLVLLGSALMQPWPLTMRTWVVAAFVGVALVPLQLFHELEDAPRDSAQQVRTTAATLGTARTVQLSCGALLVVTGVAYPVGAMMQRPWWLVGATGLWALWLATILFPLRYGTGQHRPLTGLKRRARTISLGYGLAVMCLIAR